MKRVFVGLTVLAALAWVGAAQAQKFTYYFQLSGSQEVPPNASTGSGTAYITLDTATNLLSWNISFQNLMATVTAAHFHGPAMPGQNASVRVGIAGAGAPSPIVGSTTLTNAFETELTSGLWYVNIHSTMFPGGEIRGQLVRGCPYKVGDANCDGVTDFFDIDPFLMVLLDGTAPCEFCALDANGDGVLDFFDIDPFMACVLGGGC